MVIDSENSYIKFLNENSVGRCIFYIVSENNNTHGAVSNPLLLFVKNIDTDKIFIVNVNHYDLIFSIDKNRLINDLNNLYCTKFVLNKKRFIHILPLLNLKDLELIDFINDGKIDENDNMVDGYNFYYRKFGNVKNINSIIPLSIHNKEFENICEVYKKKILTFKEDESYTNINDNIIENLGKIERNGIFIDKDIFLDAFKEKSVIPINNYVYTEYNVYTSTGRPSNCFGGINYSALNKENGCRKSFVSRHGDDGMLFLVDYSAYHPHIVAKLIKYDLPNDVYGYLGKYYFDKDELNNDEFKMSKNITFQCMYGNIPKELLDIPYFKKMNEYITHRWEFFNENGYVETPIYKRRITNKHITDPSPNKLFNYILQASETEFGMVVLSNIHTYLETKKTKVVLYTYDSFLYDINKYDGKQTLLDIKKIMSESGFPVKCYIGCDYDKMITINI